MPPAPRKRDAQETFANMLMGTRPRATRPSPPDATLFPHHRDVRGCADSRVARIRGDVLIADHPVYPSRAGSPPRRRSRRIAARSDISDTQNTLHLDLPPDVRRGDDVGSLVSASAAASHPPSASLRPPPTQSQPASSAPPRESQHFRLGGDGEEASRDEIARNERDLRAALRLDDRARGVARTARGQEPRRNRTDDSPRWSPRLARLPARPREEGGVGVGVRVRGSRGRPTKTAPSPPPNQPPGSRSQSLPRRRSPPLRGRDTIRRARRVRSRPLRRRRRCVLHFSEASSRSSRATSANPVEASSRVDFANAARRWWTTRRPAK